MGTFTFPHDFFIKIIFVVVDILKDSRGSGTAAGVIAGINWVDSQHRGSTIPAVVNMSLGGVFKSSTLVQAVENAIAVFTTLSPFN